MRGALGRIRNASSIRCQFWLPPRQDPGPARCKKVDEPAQRCEPQNQPSLHLKHPKGIKIVDRFRYRR